MNKDQVLVRMSEADVAQVLNTNVVGAINTSRAALRHMLPRRQGTATEPRASPAACCACYKTAGYIRAVATTGCLVHISSVIGIGGNAGQTVYSASKAALLGFSRSLAKEVGDRGVRSNVVAPGFIETDMTTGMARARRVYPKRTRRSCHKTCRHSAGASTALSAEQRERAMRSITLRRFGHPEVCAAGATVDDIHGLTAAQSLWSVCVSPGRGRGGLLPRGGALRDRDGSYGGRRDGPLGRRALQCTIVYRNILAHCTGRKGSAGAHKHAVGHQLDGNAYPGSFSGVVRSGKSCPSTLIGRGKVRQLGELGRDVPFNLASTYAGGAVKEPIQRGTEAAYADYERRDSRRMSGVLQPSCSAPAFLGNAKQHGDAYRVLVPLQG